MRSPRKYGNVRTEVDGISFDSKKEAKRYSELKLLERAGHIRDLELQPMFPMVINGHLVCTYIADFAYLVPNGSRVVEDVKSPATRSEAAYRIKNKLMRAIHKIDVMEV